MGEVIEVNTNTLEQDASFLNEQASLIKKNIYKMYAITDELNGMWTGPAKENFVSSLNAERETMIEALKEAEHIGELITRAVEVYKKCELSVSEEIENLKL